MLFHLQKTNIIFISFLILFFIPIKFLNAQSKNIYSWERINYKISDISLHNDEQLIIVDKKNRIRLINTFSKKIKRFPGEFKKIFFDSKNIFAISNEFKFYKLKKRIWKRIKIPSDLKFENLTIFKDIIYAVKDGKIETFKSNGKKVNNKYLNSLDNVNYIGFFDNENFIIHSKNNELFFYYKNKILEKKTNVKKILFINENYIVVSKEKNGIFLLPTQDLKQNFKKINLKKNLTKIIISKSGNIWASDGKNIYVSTFKVDDLFFNENNKKFKKEKLYASSQTATKLFSGKDGIFNIDEYGTLNYWSFKKRKFISLLIKPLEIANPKNSTLWLINSLGRIFYYNGKKWKQINGLAQSISSKENLTLIVDEKKTLMQFDKGRNKFFKTSVKAEKVFVKDDNNFWIMEKSKLKSCSFVGKKISLKTVKCKKHLGNYQSLKISDNRIFAITDKSALKIFNGDKFINYRNGPKLVNDLVGYKNNLLWFVDQKNNIFKNSNKTPKYKNLSHFESVKFVEKDIIGNGDVLLYGKKLKKNKYKSSASSANGGFTYKKNMKRNVISNNESFIDISFGIDGRLWAVSDNNEAFQYKDKTQSFKKYTRTNFSSKDQQYFGLPNRIDIKRITSDSTGKIWVVKQNSKSVFYQDKIKGKYFEKKLKGNAQNIKDLAIDASNNVYLAAGDIYKWDKSKKIFKIYYKKNGPFLKVSSGPTGTLWVINNNGKLYELIGGKLIKRPGNRDFTANDVDISVNGEVYITSEVLTITSTIRRRGQPPRSTTQVLKCFLYKYNASKNTIEHAFDANDIFSEIVTVSREGSPWYTSPECQNKNVFYGTK